MPFPPFSDYQETSFLPLPASTWATFMPPSWLSSLAHLAWLAKVVYAYWCEQWTKRGSPKTIFRSLSAKVTKFAVNSGNSAVMVTGTTRKLFTHSFLPSSPNGADEPPHQIHSYTLLFSLFLCFPYIVDLPLHTSAPMWLHTITHMTIALASLDRSHLFDGHMTYDSYVFTSILSVSNVPPPAVWPITSSCTTRSGTFYSFTICSHSCLPFVFNLPVFTFCQPTSSPKPQPIAYMSLPQNWDFALTLCTYFALFRTISHRIALPRSHCLYLPQYTWRQSLTPRSHPLRAP